MDTKTFDFQDGNGPVPAHQHPNGGGWVANTATVESTAFVGPDAQVYGNSQVYDNACVYGNTKMYGDSWVYNTADIKKTEDVLTVGLIGSRNDTTTFFRTKDGVSVHCGCFSGTLDEFEKRVKETHGDNKYGKEYNSVITLVKLQFEL